MRIKGTTTTIKDSVFESKTRAEQIEYVSNLQEYKFLPKDQKDKKVKEVLDGVNFRVEKKVRKSNSAKDTESNSKGNTRKSRAKKSED